ncbi:MAG: carboxymuconolactone decarboxylase family protein [Acidimicrobiales bacterium]
MQVMTLAQAVEPAAVDMADLEQNYRPMLKLVRELIGVVPNCDGYLEIWPPGFRTYNLLVPNLLDLPALFLNRGAPKALVGLAMYASSRAAECMYCSAHTCSFALRRGASREAVVGERTPVEEAVARLAEALSRVPADVTPELIAEVEAQLDDDSVEWIVLSVALMGFLNKFMDAMGVELETAAIADVQRLIGPTGWTPGHHQWNGEVVTAHNEVPSDGLGTYVRVFRQAPGAQRLESSWTKGMSGQVGPALVALEEEIGYAFSILASLRHRKPVRALASVLRDNLDPRQSVVGIPAKGLAAVVYARTVGNEVLLSETVQMASLLTPELGPRLLGDVIRYAEADGAEVAVPHGMSTRETAVVMLARAASPSPAEVTDLTIDQVTGDLTPAQIVEVLVWISVLQVLHRLYLFYETRNGPT